MLNMPKREVDAGIEVGRVFVGFDRAELHPFDQRCRAAELATRENLNLDAAVRCRREHLGELVAEFLLHVAAGDNGPFKREISRRGGRLHDCGARRCQRKRHHGGRNSKSHDPLPKTAIIRGRLFYGRRRAERSWR